MPSAEVATVEPVEDADSPVPSSDDLRHRSDRRPYARNGRGFSSSPSVAGQLLGALGSAAVAAAAFLPAWVVGSESLNFWHGPLPGSTGCILCMLLATVALILSLVRPRIYLLIPTVATFLVGVGLFAAYELKFSEMERMLNDPSYQATIAVEKMRSMPLGLIADHPESATWEAAHEIVKLQDDLRHRKIGPAWILLTVGVVLTFTASLLPNVRRRY
jgi:hypothetical protein